MSEATSGQGEPAVLLPDLAFINREIPIVDVLKMHNIETNGRRWRCWRADHDQHFPVGQFLKANTVRCFKCGGRSLSVVDVVCSIRRISVGQAGRWLDANFGPIPRVSKTSNIKGSAIYSLVDHWPVVPTTEDFVRCEVWRHLSATQQRLLPVILERAHLVASPWGTTEEELCEFTGVGSRNTMRAALRGLRDLGLVLLGKECTGELCRSGYPVKRTVVRLTPNSPTFRQWLVGLELMAGQRLTSDGVRGSKMTNDKAQKLTHDSSWSEFDQHTKCRHQGGVKSEQGAHTRGGGEKRGLGEREAGDLSPLYVAAAKPMGGVALAPGQEAERRTELERQKVEILEREARGAFGKR